MNVALQVAQHESFSTVVEKRIYRYRGLLTFGPTCREQCLFHPFKKERNRRIRGMQEMESSVHGDDTYRSTAVEPSCDCRTPQCLKLEVANCGFVPEVSEICDHRLVRESVRCKLLRPFYIESSRD